jgi:hypothetical protein
MKLLREHGNKPDGRGNIMTDGFYQLFLIFRFLSQITFYPFQRKRCFFEFRVFIMNNLFECFVFIRKKLVVS